MRVRRVVTGQRPDGTSVFVSDELVEPVTTELMPGAAFHQLWSSDDQLQLPTDGSPPATKTYFPPSRGFRFNLFTLGPASSAMAPGTDVGAAIAKLGDELPGMMDVMEPDNPGMHTTDTVDCELVLSGDVWLELDDGAEVHLGTGDCLIQNGTRHRWHNRSEEPVTILVCLMGAERAG